MLKRIVFRIMLTSLWISMLNLTLNIQPANAKPRTIMVPDQYLTIQAAINAANPGDTIHVGRGIYYENVRVNKTVSLIGENKLNTIIDGMGYTAVVVEADKVYVSGFTIRGSKHPLTAGIIIWESSNVTVAGNEILDNWYVGILSHASHAIIVSNNVSASGKICGIALYYCGNVTFIGNYISGTEYGIHLERSNNITFIGNCMTRNYKCAINIDWWSNGNFLVGNNITDSHNYGVRLFHSSNNNLYGNNIKDNRFGIYLNSSSNNKIYHNNFINNGQQVFSEDSINNWDDEYPSGGNYWSDYNGTDLYSGPYQNITGSDGIGDTPYVIDANNIDHYPLMKPWTPTLIVSATVDIYPQALNLRSKGKWITGYIELPEGYDVNDINVSTIFLNDTIPSEPKPIAIRNYDNDSIQDLMVKFDRADVTRYVLNRVNTEERFMTVTLTVTGELYDGTPFQGSTIIRVITPMPRFERILEKFGIFPI